MIDYSSLGSAELENIIASVAIFLVIFLIIYLPFFILGIIGKWKIFTKAGEKGYKALIPIYNQIVLCEIVGVSPWWILISIVSYLILGIIPIIGNILPFAVSIYFSVLISVSLARSFDKDNSYAVGLFFLNSIFSFILGIGKSQYKGPTPMNDFLFKSAQNIYNGSTNENVKFCSNCGSKADADTKFCTNCGSQM